MKLPAAVVASMLTACSSLPPEGSLARIKLDMQAELAEDCLRDPPRYGFPHTRAENVDLLSMTPQYALPVDGYCRRLVRRLVR